MKQTSGLNGAVGIVTALVLIVILGAIGVFIADQTLTATDLKAGTQASSSLTLSGNTSCGELINVTNIAGTKITFQLNITGTQEGYCALPLTTPYHVVQILQFQNTSTISATNITTAMNANATLSDTMIATNPSAGVVLLSYRSVGTDGDSVGTIETLANGAWDGTVLAGGVNQSSLYPMQLNLINASKTGSSFIVILVIAFIGALAIAYLSGMFKGRRS